jgi:uncharacterized DUF497 family protein
MPLPGIEWDEEKARINLATHKVSFETAQYIFSDMERLEHPDRSVGNLFGEERLHLGMVGQILFVVYTERGGEQASYVGSSRKQGGKKKLQWVLSYRR